MNRLVSYSESSDDDEKGFSPDKSAIKQENLEDVAAVIKSQSSRCQQMKLHNHAIIPALILPELTNANGSKENDILFSHHSDNGDKELANESVQLLTLNSFSYSGSTTNPETDEHNLFSNSIGCFNQFTKATTDSIVSNNNIVMCQEISDAEPNQSHAKISCDVVPRSVPLNISVNGNTITRKRKHSNENSESVLHLPNSLKTMFHDRCQRWIDEPTNHDNRIRSFPHLEGNWAAHIFFPVQQDRRFEDFVHSLIAIFEPLTFKALQEYHISLSRTVPIRHHWIEPLVTSLREQLKLLKSGITDITAVKLFTNDEKTRTFLCLELSEDDTDFMQYVRAVDKCFMEYKLPLYYENPSFHISIGWCLGDVIDEVSEDKLTAAKEMLSQLVADNPDLSVVLLQQVFCRTGNKMFAITLRDN